MIVNTPMHCVTWTTFWCGGVTGDNITQGWSESLEESELRECYCPHRSVSSPPEKWNTWDTSSRAAAYGFTKIASPSCIIFHNHRMYTSSDGHWVASHMSRDGYLEWQRSQHHSTQHWTKTSERNWYGKKQW